MASENTKRVSFAASAGSASSGSRASSASGGSGSSSGGGLPDVALTTDLNLMPSSEVPGYNSLRVQKAYRINGIEAGRLDKQIQILDRQKLHTVRLVNNNIRLTRITLEHIEASSGRSVDQQGFLGSDASSSTNSLNFAAIESENKPMFLYGERKVSRRSGKFRRIQSAIVKGKSTSANSDLGLGDHIQRPKSSISFNEIKNKVHKQLEINPDWDPNIDPPIEDIQEGDEEGPQKPINAWISEDRLTSAATTKTERTKSGKRSSVSWQISKTPPDGASLAEDGGEDVITLVEQENLKESNSNRANTPPDRPKSGIISKPKRENSGKKSRGGSASILKSSTKLADTIEEGQKENDKPTDTEESQEKAKKKSRAPSAPKPRHPRDHPMAKVVGKTRTLIGQYKKAQVSTAFWDPEKSQKGSNMEKQMKRKAEKLAKEKSRQADRNILTDRLVEDFLGKNPVPEVPENENPVTSYAQVRNLLIDRQISLVSKLDLQDYDAEIPE